MINAQITGKCIHIFNSTGPNDSETRFSIQLLCEPPEHAKSNSPVEINTYKLPKNVDVIQSNKLYLGKDLIVNLTVFGRQNGSQGFFIKDVNDIQPLRPEKQG